MYQQWKCFVSEPMGCIQSQISVSHHCGSRVGIRVGRLPCSLHTAIAVPSGTTPCPDCMMLFWYGEVCMHAAGTRVAGTERTRHQNQDGDASKVWLVMPGSRAVCSEQLHSQPYGLRYIDQKIVKYSTKRPNSFGELTNTRLSRL